MKITLFVVLLLILFTAPIYSDISDEESSKDMVQCYCPFLLSLFFSHGSGLYAAKKPEKAFPYLLANIIIIDLPIAVLIGAVIINNINPDFFQGDTLAVTEYVVNACLLSVIISIPVIRFFECLDVLKSKSDKSKELKAFKDQ